MRAKKYFCVLYTAEFMEDEVRKYESGKRWLAKMMGADVETFSDLDVEVWSIIFQIELKHEILFLF